MSFFKSLLNYIRICSLNRLNFYKKKGVTFLIAQFMYFNVPLSFPPSDSVLTDWMKPSGWFSFSSSVLINLVKLQFSRQQWQAKVLSYMVSV